MLPKQVRIVEVGPRDGLQNEKSPFSVEHKINLINLLSQSGLSYIEGGSFVSPKWVPQMANSAHVFTHIDRVDGVTYSALTPNTQGFEDALDSGVDEVAIFGSASERFSQKNINCSVDESLDRFAPVIELAKRYELPVRGYVSCVMGCPYEGDIPPENVAHIARRLHDMGCYEISLGDTIGVGTPTQTKHMLDAVGKQVPMANIGIHFHDTYGQALANIYAALDYGIASIDSAIAGLGGCPYANGASGNVATEDLLYMLNGMAIDTGVNMDLLLKASAFVSDITQRPVESKVANALLNG